MNLQRFIFEIILESATLHLFDSANIRTWNNSSKNPHAKLQAGSQQKPKPIRFNYWRRAFKLVLVDILNSLFDVADVLLCLPGNLF